MPLEIPEVVVRRRTIDKNAVTAAADHQEKESRLVDSVLQPFLNGNVAMVPVYPGFKPEILGHLAATHDGVLLEGYGSGNVPTLGKTLVPAISQATKQGVPVVVCTQCIIGSTQMERYQVGREALQAGAIPAMDMTPEAALVKLMWILGQTSDLKTVDSMMRKAFVGELHEVE